MLRFAVIRETQRIVVPASNFSPNRACFLPSEQLPKMRDFSKFDKQKLQRELEKEQQGEEITVRLVTP